MRTTTTLRDDAEAHEPLFDESEPLTWTKGDILTRRGTGEGYRRRVAGRIYGPIGLHKDTGDGLAKWRLSEMESGRYIAAFETKKAAKRCAEDIAPYVSLYASVVRMLVAALEKHTDGGEP